MSLISGGTWHAAIEGHASDGHGHRAAPEEDRGTLRYSPVIAWESYTDADGNRALRAWLSSARPVSDVEFRAQCDTHFINRFVPEKPADASDFIWA